jgi:sulfite reductase alpha subunit-like flavoprotein
MTATGKLRADFCRAHENIRSNSVGRFQAVGRAIDKKMQELGAEQVCPRGEGDDANE